VCDIVVKFYDLQMYVAVVREKKIPPQIDPPQLAKIVKMSEVFEKCGTDCMRSYLDTKAAEVCGF
jgi:hypothetical protein